MFLNTIMFIKKGCSKMSDNKKSTLNIPEFQLENLLEGFEDYRNHLELKDIPLVC